MSFLVYPSIQECPVYLGPLTSFPDGYFICLSNMKGWFMHPVHKVDRVGLYLHTVFVPRLGFVGAVMWEKAKAKKYIKKCDNWELEIIPVSEVLAAK